LPLLTFVSPLPQRSVLERYSIAIASAVLAILLRALLEPLLGHSSFYVTVYVAVVFSALLCGLGPSIVSAVLGTVGIVYWFVDPRHSLTIANRRDVHSLIGCVVACAVFIALGDANRKRRLQLVQAQDTLEQRVKERTAELSHALANLETEVAERKKAEEQQRKLSARVLTLQDDERRHIARDLHDSAGQTLAATKMSLAMLQQTNSLSDHGLKLLDDLHALTDQALQEIRTTSYLLHPPLLDECGFASAARWFVEGYTKRSGIAVECEIPEQMERLAPSLELALFRILQESLTNVHRHSGATAACVKLRCDPEWLNFEVSDNGRGIPEHRLKQFRDSNGNGGVGIAGMQERVRELGGEMRIRSDTAGTTITFLVSQQNARKASNNSCA
jgi:signal transduction histidine kinase